MTGMDAGGFGGNPSGKAAFSPGSLAVSVVSGWTVMELSGNDCAGWLHSQTSADVISVKEGACRWNAMLDRKGRLLSLFLMLRHRDGFWLLMPGDALSPFMERVESHVFLEDVRASCMSSGVDFLRVTGPEAAWYLAAGTGLSPVEAAAVLPQSAGAFAGLELAGHEVLAVRMPESGPEGWFVIPDASDGALFLDKMRDLAADSGARVISWAEQPIFSLLTELPIPPFGRCIVSETPWAEHVVSENKGCYTGQEVVARLRAYGTVRQYMTGVLWWENPPFGPPPPGTRLLVDGKKAGEAGEIRAFPEGRGGMAGWVWLGRDWRSERVLRLHGGDNTGYGAAEIRPLPLFPPAGSAGRAAALYGEALDLAGGLDGAPEKPVALLEKAHVLDPLHPDVMELLGVLLHRLGRTDEAIMVMRGLAAHFPDSVMARANLSQFYQSKGMIREAEEEKAVAALLEDKKDFDAARVRGMAEADRARIMREAESRAALFREVLEMDPGDAVALMGLGGALTQMEKPDEAAACYARAVAAHPDYSAAYLRLGMLLERLDRHGEASAAYRDGIAAAERKGDFMPMREMRRRLDALAGRFTGR